MTKQRLKHTKTSGKSTSRRRDKHSDSDKSTEDQGSPFTAVRETVESIVIAFVLAFLFRTFEAEAFVIPTGSMAPTLLGANKDVECEQCGYAYQGSASSEDPNSENLQHLDPRPRAEELQSRTIVATTCPVCNYTMTVAQHPGEPKVEEKPTYSGDRILVDKISYQIGEPERWDVFVFKYPNNSATNYIKRLVGLPNETLKIFRGDILERKPGEPDASFRHARRSGVPNRLRAMLHTVHDNHHIPRTLVGAAWPRRWVPVKMEDGLWVPLQTKAEQNAGAWSLPPIEFDESGVGRQSFEIDSTSEPHRWLRYRHVVPSFDDWQTMLATGASPSGENNFKHWLITDHYAYNNTTQLGSAKNQRSVMPPVPIGMNWVGDLGVECDVEILSESGELVLELVEGGKQFQCRVNLQDGMATFSIVGVSEALATAQTTVRGKGTHHLLFANVDNELLLWIDDSLVRFDTSTTYPHSVDTSIPNTPDQAPVGVGAAGAHLRVIRLKVLRDVYYIAMGDKFDPTWDLQVKLPDESKKLGELLPDEWETLEELLPDESKKLRGLLPDESRTLRELLPDKWNELRELLPDERSNNPAAFFHSAEVWSQFKNRNFRKVEIAIGPDEFLPMGDNSPMSQDGRIWGGPKHTVHRDLLIGKALYIYWPHAWDSPVPFWPNWGRMKLVR